MKHWRSAIQIGLGLALLGEATFYVWHRRIIADLKAGANTRPRPVREIASGASGLAPLVAVPQAAAPPHPAAGTALLWLQDAQAVRDLVLNDPDQWIPEMSLLSEKDILTAVKDADFSNEANRRSTLAQLRGTAKGKFIALAQKTLAAYIESHGGNLPAEAIQLADGAPPPLTREMFARYEMADATLAKEAPSYQLIERQPAIDPEYDSHVRFSATAVSSSAASAGPNATELALAKALREYQRQRGGLMVFPASLEELRPFVADDPVDEARLRDLYATMRRRSFGN